MKFNNFLKIKSKNRIYGRLLNTLLLLFFLAPFVNGLVGTVFITICFFYISLLTIKALEAPQKIIYTLRAIATLSLCFDIVLHFFKMQMGREIVVYGSITGSIFYSLFLLAALGVIGKKLLAEKVVNQDIIRGGISIYFLLGFFWFSLYRIVFLIDPEAFKHPLENIDINTKLVYFSFTTLTTLGYGDITPANELTMALSNLEAIVGQMYPAIVIARLVGLYSHENEKKD